MYFIILCLPQKALVLSIYVFCIINTYCSVVHDSERAWMLHSDAIYVVWISEPLKFQSIYIIKIFNVIKMLPQYVECISFLFSRNDGRNTLKLHKSYVKN